MIALGLAGGCDNFGASLQYSGLVVALVAVAKYARDPTSQGLALGLTAGCPVVAFLVTSQKPQMLLVGGVTCALVGLLDERVRWDGRRFALAMGAVCFALGSKHSFIMSGTVVLALGLVLATRDGFLRPAISTLAVCVFALPLPVWARGLWFYGDPMPPLLERFKEVPDSGRLAFAHYLREAGSGMTFSEWWRIPLDLVVTTSPGNLTTVLGIGGVAWIFCWRAAGPGRALLVAALAHSCLVLAGGQVTGRFLLEPYLWCAAALAATEPRGRWWSAWRLGLAGQVLGVAFVAGGAAVIMAPGSWSKSGRNEVMSKLAAGYVEAEWVGDRLGPETVQVGWNRSHALARRPFVVSDVLEDWSGVGPTKEARLADAIDKYGVNTVVAGVGPDGQIVGLGGLEACGKLLGWGEGNVTARNPFNRGGVYRFGAWSVGPGFKECVLGTGENRPAGGG